MRRYSLAAVVLSALPLMAHANPGQDKLMELAEPERKALFASLLQRSGESCRSASRTFLQGSDREGNAFWNVDCGGGHSYVIQLNNDPRGSTRVLSCKLFEGVKAGKCFQRFK